MDTSIRRVQPEAAIQQGAVRAVNARRRRGSGEGREFADQLDAPGDEERASPEEESGEAKHDRPPDGETGSLLDVTA